VQEGQEFLRWFLGKLVGDKHNYNIVKQNFTYPLLIDQLILLQAREGTLSLPIFARDLEAMRRVLNQQLIKASKEPKRYRHEYQ
jgi:hypothetical protein